MNLDQYRHLDGKLTEISEHQTEIREGQAEMRTDLTHLKSTVETTNKTIEALSKIHTECPARKAHDFNVTHRSNRSSFWKSVALFITTVAAGAGGGAAMYQVSIASDKTDKASTKTGKDKDATIQKDYKST